MKTNFCSSLIIVIVLLINLLIVNYTRKLEKITCNCSKDWRRTFIKVYAMATIGITTLFIVLPIIGQVTGCGPELKKILTNPVTRLIINIYAVVGVVNIVSLFTYSQKIVLNSCECSESWERTFIYYYSMVVMSIYIFTGAMLLLVVLCASNTKLMSALGKSMKKSKSLKGKNKDIFIKI